jgi:hypothetical protein
VAKIGKTQDKERPIATTDELIDNLMKDYKKPEDLIGENGLLKQLTKRLLERAMQTELAVRQLTSCQKAPMTGIVTKGLIVALESLKERTGARPTLSIV